MAFEFDPTCVRRALRLERPELSDREINEILAKSEVRHWIEEHHGQWNHDDWLALLKRTQYFRWRITSEELGRLLEDYKRKWQVR